MRIYKIIIYLFLFSLPLLSEGEKQENFIDKKKIFDSKISDETSLKKMTWKDISEKKDDLRKLLSKKLSEENFLGFEMLFYLDELKSSAIDQEDLLSLNRLYGISYIKIRDYSTAIDYLKKDLLSFPNFSSAYLLSYCLFASEEVEKSYEILKDLPDAYDISEENEEFYKILYFLSSIENNLEKQALSLLKEEEEGTLFWYYGNIYVLLKGKNYLQANVLIKEVNTLYPHDVLPVENIFYYYFKNSEVFNLEQQKHFFIAL